MKSLGGSLLGFKSTCIVWLCSLLTPPQMEAQSLEHRIQLGAKSAQVGVMPHAPCEVLCWWEGKQVQSDDGVGRFLDAFGPQESSRGACLGCFYAGRKYRQGDQRAKRLPNGQPKSLRKMAFTELSSSFGTSLDLQDTPEHVHTAHAHAHAPRRGFNVRTAFPSFHLSSLPQASSGAPAVWPWRCGAAKAPSKK